MCLEFSGELVDRLITFLWRFRERFGQDSLQIKGQLRPAVAGKQRIAVKDGMHRVDAIVVNERRRARQHFAKHNAKRKDIAAAIDRWPNNCSGAM